VIKSGGKIKEINDFNVERDFSRLASEADPVVLRGLASHWPLVQQARSSDSEASRYLLGYYQQAPVTAFVSQSDIGGRIFYTDDLADTNFTQTKMPLDRLLAQLDEHVADASAATIYMGSMALDYCLPGLRDQNSLSLGDIKATVRIWIGNRTLVAAHYDVMDNIACVCAGRRRFTLFPPDQLPNLYVGPLDFTPAGQPVSLVDARNPDLDQYPRFSEALEHAQSAELDPGDAIFVPSMWWHQVEALEDFNILINHWWRDAPAHMGAPGDALLHAILSIRDLSEAQRDAWQGLFDHYVFAACEQSVDHIPEGRLGILGELDEDGARKIRTLLRNKLNR
jgi:hypothetical protein